MDIGMRSLHPAAADHSVSIRGSRCTALIILSLRSRAVVFTTALLTLREAYECGRYGTAAVVAVSRENNGPWRQSHRSVRWPAPLRASALKEQISLKSTRVIASFKDVLSPVRFWVWSISGASGRSRSLPHVSGHSARWGSFRGWFMFFLWGHDHLGVAQ